MNGFVYTAKLNSTPLNEDSFALSHYRQNSPTIFPLDVNYLSNAFNPIAHIHKLISVGGGDASLEG